MDKTTQPQQLSFSFEAPMVAAMPAVVSLAATQVATSQDLIEDVEARPAVVYDFRTALTKRKESAHASLYRQILDSVRHIG